MAEQRGRIGLIIPASNRLTEPHFNRYAPDGVQTHVTRLRMTGPHRVPVLDLLPKIAEAAQMLGDAQCDVIVFHCTASSTEAGRDAEARVVETIRGATGAQATTTGSALLEALGALEARRLVALSPYLEESSAREIAFLDAARESNGGDHVARKLTLDFGRQLDGIRPLVPRRVARQLPEAEDPREPLLSAEPAVEAHVAGAQGTSRRTAIGNRDLVSIRRRTRVVLRVGSI